MNIFSRIGDGQGRIDASFATSAVLALAVVLVSGVVTAAEWSSGEGTKAGGNGHESTPGANGGPGAAGGTDTPLPMKRLDRRAREAIRKAIEAGEKPEGPGNGDSVGLPTCSGP